MRRSSFDWTTAKRRRWRQQADRRRQSSFVRRLHTESLEDRCLLTVITVDTLTDEADGSINDGDISLRDAIALASPGDTIDFDAALDGGTILLVLGELVVTQSLTIDATALASGLTIDASGNDPTPGRFDGSRVLNIDDGNDTIDSEVTLSGLTLTGLTLTGGDVDGNGGAVYSAETLRVMDGIIKDNLAFGFAGGGGISGNAVTIANSTISGAATQ